MAIFRQSVAIGAIIGILCGSALAQDKKYGPGVTDAEIKIGNFAPYSGPGFKKSDLARVPLRDFGFGAPAWMGTGNTAIRLNRNEPLPAAAQNNPTILWVAIEDEG